MNCKGKTILVVDDDRTTRLIIAQMLQAEGFVVEQAGSGEECLQAASEKAIDGFLIDINMPGIGGIELCRELRAMEAYSITPIIFITSLDEHANLGEVFDAGATDFINKPINNVVLKARLLAHMQRVEYFIKIERVRGYLNRYISNRTQKMVETYSQTGVLPAPEHREVCVMFTDVRGFTSLSQRIDPEVLFAKLNAQLGMQVDRVYRHGGYIDKFGGDGLMAIFDSEDMASRACHCALEILDIVQSNQGDNGKYILPIGIGLHMGKVLIGNIGSEEHLDYSAIGEAVNLAARLCSHAEAMTIDASEVIVKAAGVDQGLRFTAPLTVNIRGIKEPVSIYKVKQADGASGRSTGT